jgi:hypothetical protein
MLDATTKEIDVVKLGGGLVKSSLTDISGSKEIQRCN